ncbi:MAG: PqqD family protein [Candidatus Krumholzibacteriota bacterium]|nr:PqqD family protein [Candidatus Krumholzibacteriota bacterium]
MKPEKEINKKEVNLLKLIPERQIEYSTGEDGIVTLLALKFKNRFLVKYLLPRFKNRFFKYKLDKIGSFVWLMCDGEKRVEEIGDLMKEEFGEEAEPLLDRLGLFLSHLEKSGYISFTNVEK